MDKSERGGRQNKSSNSVIRPFDFEGFTVFRRRGVQMSEPTTSKLGLKLPESPNTAKEKQKCQLRNQMRGQVRTNDAVVGPLLEVRHDDIDLSVQNVETLCQDHCFQVPPHNVSISNEYEETGTCTYMAS